MNPLDQRFQVVTGKGGVGRTVVATAIALRSAQAGVRTLLLEVNAPDSVSRYLKVRPAVDDPREVLPNLWLCRMSPDGAIREYALMILRFRAVYNLVFENRLVKYLLRSIPSLGEYTMLGKTWYHSTELVEGEPKYERIIVDAPATGHAMTFLSSARVVANTMPTGVMKSASERMAALIEANSSCFHLVATPEEMPVTEALGFAEVAKSRIGMKPGLAVMNRVLDPLLTADEAQIFERLEAEASPEVQPYLDAAKRRLDWQRFQADCVSRFAASSHMPLVRLPEMKRSTRIDREWLERLAASFEPAAGGAEA